MDIPQNLTESAQQSIVWETRKSILLEEEDGQVVASLFLGGFRLSLDPKRRHFFSELFSNPSPASLFHNFPQFYSPLDTSLNIISKTILQEGSTISNDMAMLFIKRIPRSSQNQSVCQKVPFYFQIQIALDLTMSQTPTEPETIWLILFKALPPSGFRNCKLNFGVQFGSSHFAILVCFGYIISKTSPKKLDHFDENWVTAAILKKLPFLHSKNEAKIWKICKMSVSL